LYSSPNTITVLKQSFFALITCQGKKKALHEIENLVSYCSSVLQQMYMQKKLYA